jgi:hypothetical protein
MAKRNSKDKIVQIATNTETDNGILKKSSRTEKVVVSKEPDYIKLYLNTLLVFKDLPKQMSPLLLELLKLMSYADPDSDHGGQLIQLTGFSKKSIATRLNIKINTIDHALVKLKKAGIIKQLGPGAFQANPHMFGRGEWLDIKAIRAKFDFNAGTVDADITISTEQSPAMNEPEGLSFLERGAAGKVLTDDEANEDD